MATFSARAALSEKDYEDLKSGKKVILNSAKIAAMFGRGGRSCKNHSRQIK